MDYTVCGILQARILEWVAFPFSRVSSQTRDWTQVSCIGRRVLYCWATGGNPDKKSVRCQGDIQVILSIRYLTLKALKGLTTSHWLYKVKVKVTQSCPALCNPMAWIVHGILQAKILEWVAIPFSRGSSQRRDQNQVFHIAGGFFTSWAMREVQGYWNG